MNIVKLSVHKNNSEQRKAKDFRKRAISNFKRSVCSENMSSYVFVTWNKEGGYRTGWDISKESAAKPEFMPDYVKQLLIAEMMKIKE